MPMHLHLGGGILADRVIPVGIGIAGKEAVKSQLPQTTTNLFSGSTRAYFKNLAELFTLAGDWILEFDSANGTSSYQ